MSPPTLIFFQGESGFDLQEPAHAVPPPSPPSKNNPSLHHGFLPPLFSSDFGWP